MAPAFADHDDIQYVSSSVITPEDSCRLNDAVLESVGKLACARPIYGCGWSEGGSHTTSGSPIDVPVRFHFKIAEFFDWNAERRGGIGLIQEAGHIYDGRWLLFYTRQVGCFDFTNRIGHYNFHIGRQRPSLHPPSSQPEMAKRWPLPRFSDGNPVWGFGQIGVSIMAIEEFDRKGQAHFPRT